MNIVIIGRGNVGGGLARLWSDSGHTTTALGRDGGDASEADVVVVAVPSDTIEAAVAKVSGVSGKVTIDTTNAFGAGRCLPVAGAPGEVDHRRAGGQELQHQLRRAL